MKAELVNEIIDCLPSNRTIFHYTKDQYASYLLHRLIANGFNTVQQLKQSQCKKLLDKPRIKDLLKNSDKRNLDKEEFEYHYSHHIYSYVLTLGRWGDAKNYGWNQTSRPGSNLVLQLNLPESLDSEFKKLAGFVMNRITSSRHPQSQKRSATLAWARLDIDFDSGQVLIEEIQSDLIRELDYVKNLAQSSGQTDDIYFKWGSKEIHRQHMLKYCDKILNEQKKIWAEAMLAASLWFIHRELGLHKVFYNSFDTGNQMKGITYAKPPRSLYTDLPEKFCFDLTKEVPYLFNQDKKAQSRLKKIENAQWYQLAI